MNIQTRSIVAWLFLLTTACPNVFAQAFTERFSDWPTELKINGSVILSADSQSPQAVQWYALASETSNAIVVCEEPLRETLEPIYEHIPVQWNTAEEFLNVTQGSTAAGTFVAWHEARTIQQLESSWNQDRLAAIRLKLNQVIQQGGTVALLGSISQWAGSECLRIPSTTRGVPTASPTGFGLLPDCLIAINYNAAEQRSSLLEQLTSLPRMVGIGLEPETTLVLEGRKIVVFGTGSAHFLIPAGEHTPLHEQSIAPRRRNSSPSQWLIDLTQWRRMAIDRMLTPFPPPKRETPQVESGSLVIVGGGGMPVGLMERFVELAGGAANARLVFIPCSEQDTLEGPQSIVESWKRMGVRTATWIHTKDRTQADQDQQFLEPLRDATGIWFGGGRQWNLADSYYGTTAQRLMQATLQRGGVIGGSSAGASIQASYLARATPIENLDIMAPGYERGGLGFIRGVAIDQHFSQRGRQKDLLALKARYPQLLGIGIDEATAIVVQGSIAEVVGKGEVYFYDQESATSDQPDSSKSQEQPPATLEGAKSMGFTALSTGQHYDLASRQVVER